MEYIDKDRRKLLITDVDQWPLSLKQNIISKLKIDIDKDLWNECCEITNTLKNPKIRGALQMYPWPDCKPFDNLRSKLEIFKNDVSNWFIMSQSGRTQVYPHNDPVRKCSVYMPLLPKGDDYTPLEIFYQNEQYGIPENNDPTVYVWNPQVKHAVYQFGQPRYNVQMTMKIAYQEFFEKYKELFDI